MDNKNSTGGNANKPPLKKEDAFYIGWMPEAPNLYANHTRKFLLALAALVLIAGTLLALSQKKFSTSSFEFGQLTTVTGIYLRQPVPSIKTVAGYDLSGNTNYLTIPLVGYGKFGAEGVMEAIEKEKHLSLDKKEVTLKGTLLYSDGKSILQVDQHDDPLVSINEGVSEYQPKITGLGPIQIKGEILDPKCYFGVMKPGHGKPHRDCAIRCLLGGISPVFRVRDEKGRSNYYLLLGENGERINEQLQDFIADPVELEANAIQYDDWIVLNVNATSIKRINALSWIKNADDEFASCGASAIANSK